MPIRQDTLRERWLAQQQYAETTRSTYREVLRRFERRHPTFAEKVTAAMLIDFLTTEANGEPATRAPSTLDRERATLRSFWRWAHRAGYVKADPADRLDELVLGQGQRRAGRWLTRQEATHLLASVGGADDQDLRDHLLILTALLTGLRRSELVGLRWRDVDLGSRRISVRGKGSKFATVGMPDQLHAALLRWRQRVIERTARNPRPDAPLLPTGHASGGLRNTPRQYVVDWSTPLAKWSARAIVARRAEEAGLGVVATHDLRRSFAGFLDDDGVGMQGIQAALRHSSPDVTARCYLDPSPRRAIEAVAGLRL